MFFSHISIATKYNYLDEKFRAAYKWLAETDLTKLSAGSYPILGDEVVANIQEYTTLDPKEARFETHIKFFDIQYIISGAEQFGLCKGEGLIPDESIPERDLYFYKEPEESGSLLLKEGDLIVVEPEEAHKPRLMTKEGPKFVRKVVVKVRV